MPRYLRGQKPKFPESAVVKKKMKSLGSGRPSVTDAIDDARYHVDLSFRFENKFALRGKDLQVCTKSFLEGFN